MFAEGSFGRKSIPVASILLVGIVALLLPLIGLSSRVLSLSILVGIYAIVTYGISFLYGTGGLLSIAQGGLWGVGAYIAAILAINHGWSFPAVLLVAIVGTALLSTLVALLSLRVRGHYFTIITFAVAEGIRALINAWQGLTGGTVGIVVSKPASIGPWQISTSIDWYDVCAVTLVVVLVVVHFLTRSRFGRRLAGTRDNVELAASVGISLGRLRVIAFAISGALAGLGGVYWAFSQSYVQGDQFGATASITFILVMLLGGAKYLYGPLIGAIVVVFLPVVLDLPPLLGTAALGVVFILVILLAPRGIASLGDVIVRLVRRRSRTGTGAPPAPLGDDDLAVTSRWSQR
jgi:branched-chain amino acid transport system permease protein